ncbi:MAG: hypothetical protein GX638_14815 [Crenarchaeota archaeon]|nr:hypothetical protein [Thermoproteota archaeon]
METKTWFTYLNNCLPIVGITFMKKIYEEDESWHYVRNKPPLKPVVRLTDKELEDSIRRGREERRQQQEEQRRKEDNEDIWNMVYNSPPSPRRTAFLDRFRKEEKNRIEKRARKLLKEWQGKYYNVNDYGQYMLDSAEKKLKDKRLEYKIAKNRLDLDNKSPLNRRLYMDAEKASDREFSSKNKIDEKIKNDKLEYVQMIRNLPQTRIKNAVDNTLDTIIHPIDNLKYAASIGIPNKLFPPKKVENPNIKVYSSYSPGEKRKEENEWINQYADEERYKNERQP